MFYESAYPEMEVFDALIPIILYFAVSMRNSSKFQANDEIQLIYAI